MTIDIDKMYEAAKGATQGRWFVEMFGDEGIIRAEDGVFIETVYTGIGNATHIATSNPAAVISLIDELMEARIEIQRLQRRMVPLQPSDVISGDIGSFL